jgi:hypothetical protein
MRYAVTLTEATPTPTHMYHASPTSNRSSIQQRGLRLDASPAYQAGGWGGIFFSTKKGTDAQWGIDQWRVDVRGLKLMPDETTDPEDPEDEWYYVMVDVPPSRLVLDTPG